MLFAAKWVEMEIPILSTISQAQKNFHMWKIDLNKQ
jgi:hypothetical protein